MSKYATEYDEVLPGMGKIIIQWDNNHKMPKYTITIPKADASIQIMGSRAIEFGKRIFENDEQPVVEEINTDISEIVNAANAATGGDAYCMNRQQPNKLARYLVTWHLHVNKGLTLRQSGEKVNIHYTTVIHGVKILKEEPRFRSDYENDAIQKFKDILKIDK